MVDLTNELFADFSCFLESVKVSSFTKAAARDNSAHFTVIVAFYDVE